jgi:hypothetical protein
MTMAIARRRRHSKLEIADKLAQAEAMAAEGKIQSEIARALEVSVMTLHRWRKAPPLPAPETPHYAASAGVSRETRIAQLQAENTRLRRLVTDLLLETMQMQEAAEQSSSYADDRKRIAQ